LACHGCDAEVAQFRKDYLEPTQDLGLRGHRKRAALMGGNLVLGIGAEVLRQQEATKLTELQEAVDASIPEIEHWADLLKQAEDTIWKKLKITSATQLRNDLLLQIEYFREWAPIIVIIKGDLYNWPKLFRAVLLDMLETSNYHTVVDILYKEKIFDEDTRPLLHKLLMTPIPNPQGEHKPNVITDYFMPMAVDHLGFDINTDRNATTFLLFPNGGLLDIMRLADMGNTSHTHEIAAEFIMAKFGIPTTDIWDAWYKLAREYGVGYVRNFLNSVDVMLPYNYTHEQVRFVEQARDFYTVYLNYFEAEDRGLNHYLPNPNLTGPELIQKAVNYFGITYNPLEAGYLLPDGRMLDFSGRHWATMTYKQRYFDKSWELRKPNERDFCAGHRQVDHREIKILWENYIDSGNTPWYYMQEFMKRTGAIRLSIHEGFRGMEILTMPTPKQIDFYNYSLAFPKEIDFMNSNFDVAWSSHNDGDPSPPFEKILEIAYAHGWNSTDIKPNPPRGPPPTWRELTKAERSEVYKRFGYKLQCSIKFDSTKPPDKKHKAGYFCHTHRARSRGYPSIDKIPMKVYKFICSTG
jgi:hypothetical protein